MTRNSQAIAQEALDHARSGQSFANYPAIIQGFMAKCIAPADIVPRENVFTFHAWKALGRSVKKGEHGVKVATFAEVTKTDEKTGEVSSYRRPWFTTVFHISQTAPIGERAETTQVKPEPAVTAEAQPRAEVSDRWIEE